TNLQLLRSVDTAFITRTVYTQAARNGLFRYVSGNTVNADGSTTIRQNAPTGTGIPSVDSNGNPLFGICPNPLPNPIPAGFGCLNSYSIAANPTGVGLDPRLLTVINSTPLPNNFSAGDGLNTAGYTFGTPGRERQYDFVMKFDYKLNDNNQFYVRYGAGEQNTFGDGGANGGRPIFPNSPNIVDTFRKPKNFAFNYRWSPVGNITNEVIFGISRFAFKFNTPTPDPAIPYSFNNSNTPNLNFSYNARSVKTYQFIDNITWIKGDHIVKGGINFRYGRAFDDRSGVAGTQIEPLVAFNPPTATLSGFNLPTAIATNDLTRLRGTINDLLGRIGSYSQAFVSDPDNPNQFAPAGTRWLFNATYPEYDFYAQDTYKFRPNLTFDLGLRWEFKLSPKSDGRPILAPDKPFTIGAPPANDIKFVERKLFDNDLNNFSPSIGFAWDPLKDGKTSIRANYRLAYDRFATFLFSSSIFQNAPGNTALGNNPTFNAAGNLIRNGLPNLAPTGTPQSRRQPDAFGTGSVTVIDPDLKFPEIHQYALSFQREIFNNAVIEVNYIGKHGTNLIGGYNANQVNLQATDPRCGSQTFLEAFIAVQNPTNTSVCLINYLIGGNNNAANTTTFRTSGQFATQITNNAVASVAQTLSSRTGAVGTSTASLTANGFSSFFFQRYTQFLGALNVIDSNDVSRYNAVEFIFKRRFNKGLGFQFGYTLSNSKDTRSFDPVFTTVATGSSQAASSTSYDINDRRLNYAPSDFDRRHVFQATYVYELPIGRGARFGSDIPKALDYIVGGWQLAGNILWTSGSPFTVYSGSNTFSNVVQSTANCNGCTRNTGSLVQESGTNFYFDAATRAMFSNPAAGSNGDTGRNFFIKPRYFQTDLSVSKKIKVSERFNFDLRLDARNLFNTVSFDNPTAVFNSPIFGRIRDSVISGSRKMQISVKLNF
ncbi:MAG: TonB-dependent receptor, partial [Pyrinomonadaceae bacterium]|nr:TonB-dependent receptor [Pyrinomonadaceae bacterium]